MTHQALVHRVHIIQRRMSYLFLLFGIAFVACLTAAFELSAQDELSVRSILLLDEQDRVRGEFSITSGQPRLTFFAADGSVLGGLGLSTGNDAPTVEVGQPLLFFGPPATPSVLWASSTSTPGREVSFLSLGHTAETGMLVHLQAQPNSGSLGMTAVDELRGPTPRVILTAAAQGGSMLEFRDANGDLAYSTERRVEYDGSNQFPVTSIEDLRTLERLRPRPQTVDVFGDAVDDNVVRELSKLGDIRYLVLRGASGLGPDSLRLLATMQGLIDLHIVNCPEVAGQGYNSLRGLAVKRLGLVSMPMDSSLIEVLATMNNLEEVVLSEGLDEDLVTRLKESLPNVRITVSGR